MSWAGQLVHLLLLGLNFLHLFLERYIPFTTRNELRNQFEHLHQDHISVTEYEARIIELSHYTTFFIPTEAKKVW